MKYTFHPTVAEMKPRVKAFYEIEGNSVGGVLHSVLDDGNIGKDSIEFCLNRAIEIGDTVAEGIARDMLTMSKRARYRLCAER